jgi:hypothetical protein
MYTHDGARDRRAVYSFSLGSPGIRVLGISGKGVKGGVAAQHFFLLIIVQLPTPRIVNNSVLYIQILTQILIQFV